MQRWRVLFVVMSIAWGGLPWAAITSQSPAVHMVPGTSLEVAPHDPAKDPSVGSVIEIGIESSSQTEDARLLLVAAGNCDSCSIGKFDYKQVDARKYASRILLVTTHGDQVPTSFKHVDGYITVADRKGELTEKLNAS